MCFEGTGASFVTAFRERIHHILETNGAFYNGTSNGADGWDSDAVIQASGEEIRIRQIVCV